MPYLSNRVRPLAIVTMLFAFWSCSSSNNSFHGLIGIYYSEANLESPKGITKLDSLYQKWDDTVDFQEGSSAEWKGFLIWPYKGKVEIIISATTKVSMNIDGEGLVAEKSENSYRLEMEKGKKYPLHILFYYEKSSREIGEFHIQWAWEGHKLSTIGGNDIFHTPNEIGELQWYNDLDEISFDSTKYLRAINAKHSIVYYEKSGFAAWPANSGIWSWGNEILVGFTRGYFKKNFYHHSLDHSKPNKRTFARSKDGGVSWEMEDNTELPRNESKPLNAPVNFMHPDLAIINQDNRMYVSNDRGNSWEGPFQYPDFNIGRYSSRTDYIIEDKNTYKAFLSSKYLGNKSNDQDRSFMAETTDGGKSFEFVSWISETDTLRSVMSSTVKVSDNHLITALRRRYDAPRGINHSLRDNWIDVYESKDGGRTWSFLSKIANTDRGRRNGNPPSLVKLSNGMLCVTYAYRGLPYSIRARASTDNGKSWSKEIIVRDDAAKWDLGYLRTVVRPDDKIVMVYYFTSHDVEEQHIEATIWDPRQVEEYSK